MDPLTGILLGVILWAFSALFAVVLWPFRKINEAASAHPKRTAKMVLSAAGAGLLAYGLDLPWVLHFVVAGGALGWILDLVL